MFKIRADQESAFEDQAERQFEITMAQHLCKRNICVLPSYPKKQRQRIVQIMIQRARGWDLTWESSLALYGDLMQTVAPNFDHHPEIQEFLTSNNFSDSVDDYFGTINRLVRRTVWREAESDRIELFLYTGKEFDSADHFDRIVESLPLVLWDKINSNNAEEVLSLIHI